MADSKVIAFGKKLKGKAKNAALGKAPSTVDEQGRFVANWLDGEFLMIREWGKWIKWTGVCWELDHREVGARTAAKEALAECWELALNGGLDEKSVEFKINDFRKTANKDLTASLALAELDVNESHEELGTHTDILPVENGTLELKSGLLRQSMPGDLMLNAAPVKFDEQAQCPLWTAFLSAVLPDAEVREFFQTMIGYCLTGDVGAQKFFYLYGEGANGKSTAMDVIQSLLGRYYTNGNPSLIVAGKDEHSTAMADLHGKRVAAFSEVAESAKLNEVSVKQLTGGETIKARRMREDFWEFSPTHKIIISGNHKLSVSGSDNAIWRRPVLIKFPVQIPESKRDPHLTEKLKAELPGVLNWALVGAQRYYREGLKVPEVLQSETDKYREESDWCQAVIDDEFLVNDEKSVDRATVMQRFKNYFERNSEKPKSARAIYAALERKGHITVKRNGRRYCSGLELKIPEHSGRGGFPDDDY
jgi:putative DNA primase/helicase